jgi:hypothetical protein
MNVCWVHKKSIQIYFYWSNQFWIYETSECIKMQFFEIYFKFFQYVSFLNFMITSSIEHPKKYKGGDMIKDWCWSFKFLFLFPHIYFYFFLSMLIFVFNLTKPSPNISQILIFLESVQISSDTMLCKRDNFSNLIVMFFFV